jgi:hypothetical protein
MIRALCSIGALTLLSACQQDDPVKRIEAGCQREFGSRGEMAVNDCKIRLMMRHLAEQERGRLDRAAR